MQKGTPGRLGQETVKSRRQRGTRSSKGRSYETVVQSAVNVRRSQAKGDNIGREGQATVKGRRQRGTRSSKGHETIVQKALNVRRAQAIRDTKSR